MSDPYAYLRPMPFRTLGLPNGPPSHHRLSDSALDVALPAPLYAAHNTRQFNSSAAASWAGLDADRHWSLPLVRVEGASHSASNLATQTSAQSQPNSFTGSPMMPQPSAQSWGYPAPLSPEARRRHSLFLAQSLHQVISREPESSILLSQVCMACDH